MSSILFVILSIVLFVFILSVLVIAHELGHFFVAKRAGIRVDEFGLGYPPRAKALFMWKGTLFTLNWLPFGGFVKIFGEDGAELGKLTPLEKEQSFKTSTHTGCCFGCWCCYELSRWMVVGQWALYEGNYYYF